MRWRPRLEAVDLPLGEVLYESGSTLSHVYFTPTAIVSLLYVLEDGASAEIAVVGNEGLNEFERAPVLHLLLRTTQALITQMSQTAVCNRHPSLDQQLCRWLLLSLDRLHGSELVMTRELIADMLGVRREGVTEGAKVSCRQSCRSTAARASRSARSVAKAWSALSSPSASPRRPCTRWCRVPAPPGASRPPPSGASSAAARRCDRYDVDRVSSTAQLR